MAVYASAQDIEDAYGLDWLIISSDREGDGTEDSTSVSQALTDASAEIDSYVAAKYDLPLATTPTRFVKLAVDMAVYHLSTDAGVLTEEKRQRYDDAIRWLRDLDKGVLSLGLEDPPSSVGGGAKLVASDTTARLFTRSKMRGLL